MKKVNLISRVFAITAIVGFVVLVSCTSKVGKVSIDKTELDSLKNQITTMVADNEILAKNLSTFDTLDFTVFSKQQ